MSEFIETTAGKIRTLEWVIKVIKDPWMNPDLAHPQSHILKSRILSNKVLQDFYRPDLYRPKNTPSEEELEMAQESCVQDLRSDVVGRTALKEGMALKDHKVLFHNLCIVLFSRISQSDVPYHKCPVPAYEQSWPPSSTIN